MVYVNCDDFENKLEAGIELVLVGENNGVMDAIENDIAKTELLKEIVGNLENVDSRERVTLGGESDENRGRTRKIKIKRTRLGKFNKNKRENQSTARYGTMNDPRNLDENGSSSNGSNLAFFSFSTVLIYFLQ